jgi:hypothetical protein
MPLQFLKDLGQVAGLFAEAGQRVEDRREDGLLEA